MRPAEEEALVPDQLDLAQEDLRAHLPDALVVGEPRGQAVEVAAGLDAQPAQVAVLALARPLGGVAELVGPGLVVAGTPRRAAPR